MHAFLAGLAVGIFGGGALAYLYAQKVVNEYKNVAAEAQKMASGVKKAL